MVVEEAAQQDHCSGHYTEILRHKDNSQPVYDAHSFPRIAVELPIMFSRTFSARAMLLALAGELLDIHGASAQLRCPLSGAVLADR